MFGVPFDISKPVMVAATNALAGGREQPLTVVPRVELSFQAEYAVVPRERDTYQVAVDFRNHSPHGSHGEVHRHLPEGWSCDPARPNFNCVTQRSEDRSKLPSTFPKRWETLNTC